MGFKYELMTRPSVVGSSCMESLERFNAMWKERGWKSWSVFSLPNVSNYTFLFGGLFLDPSRINSTPQSPWGAVLLFTLGQLWLFVRSGVASSWFRQGVL